MKSKKLSIIESVSNDLTQKVGTPSSILLHSIAFIGIFLLLPLGISLDQVLLILTTAVSLEAIYLALFIQMTVNKHAESIQEVGQDIGEIGDDIEDLGENLGDISDDLEEIQEDISEEDPHEKVYASQVVKMLNDIQSRLDKIEKDLINQP